MDLSRLNKAILASAGLLALFVPEVFQAFFESLRQSQYLWLYQAACIVWTAVLVLAMVPWQRVLRSKSAARIKVEVDRGTARMGLLGMVPKASADLLITNDGPPIALIAHARLTNVAPGFAWASQDAWKYDPRQLKGGPDTSWFHIATVQPDDKAPNQWVVVVRAEHMVHIRRWEVQAKGALWFDLHFDFYADTGNTLRLIRSVGVHVSVADDRKSFVTNLKQ